LDFHLIRERVREKTHRAETVSYLDQDYAARSPFLATIHFRFISKTFTIATAMYPHGHRKLFYLFCPLTGSRY
jgi:hypothetical protein